jgi:DNA-binding transcriptional LysR family regulator
MTDFIDQESAPGPTLRQLATFVAVARAGSTRAAAERVARSQSAASAALAELESALGVLLFDRVGRRLVLNEQGRALLPRAIDLLGQAGEIRRMFGAADTGTLRVAASFTVGEYLLPPLIARWKQDHPDVRLRLDIANTRAVLDAVAGLEVDVGFIEGARTHPDLDVVHWRDDELVVVAAATHPMAGRRVDRAWLREAPWILREPGSGTREAADRWLVPGLRRFRIEMELGSNEAVKRSVAAGQGVGLLSAHAVAEAIEAGLLVRLHTPLPSMRRALAIVTHRERRPGQVLADFLAHCRRQGQAASRPSETATLRSGSLA